MGQSEASELTTVFRSELTRLVEERERYREALRLIADGNQHAPSIAKVALRGRTDG